MIFFNQFQSKAAHMTTKKKPSFEEAMDGLEKIIGKLESEDLSLDKALDYFEEGVALMRSCEEQLKSAEGKLKELLKGENGEFVEKVLGDTLASIDSGGEERE
jgi:exodeoxyribonuclease VII small subunit